MNADENAATIYYRISRYGETSEWYEYHGYSLIIDACVGFTEIEAYAQVDGKLPSEICHAQYDFNGDTEYEWLATLYYIDGLYFIQPYSYFGGYTVALSNANPWIGGPFNLYWDEDEPSNYSGVIVVPDYAQWNGYNLTVDRIYYRTFANSNVTRVVLPNTITDIEDGAFYGCLSLNNIEIPNSVTTFGKGVFSGCTGLTSIMLSNSLTYIEDETFYECSSLNNLEIPNSVKGIGENAFYGCSSLTSITFPNSILAIARSAFNGCTGLTSVSIPNSVISVGYSAFTRCNGLSSIKVDSDNPKYDSRNNCNAIIETSSNTLIAGCKNTTIPNTVTSIALYAFCYHTGLTNINIPSSVTSIGNGAFSGCSGLTSIEIPNSVISIGNDAFSYCSGLTDIYIPESLISIGGYTFSNCVNLTSITIPNSVTSVGRCAFECCNNLASLSIYAINPPSATRLFDRTLSGNSYLYNQVTLFVPAESLEAYKSHEEWGKFTHIVPFLGAGPGDINGDGNIAINDVTNLIDQLLGSDELPAYADVNGDGVVTIKDVTDLIDMLLNGN